MSNKDRFTELVTTIDLLPEDMDDISPDDVRFPNYTDGITVDIGRALITHAVNQSGDWRAKLYFALMNTAMASSMENDRKPRQEDLEAFAIAGNIAWLSREGKSALKALGTIALIIDVDDELEMPSLAYAILKSPSVADELKTHSPYEYLES